MPDDQSPNEMVEVELRRLRDDNFSVHYCNWVQAGRTPWDIALVVGRVQEVNPGDTAVLELANIVMTPALAKALVGTLTSIVTQYEHENGTIVIPETLKKLAQQRAKRLSSSPSASRSPSASVSPSASASPSPENDEES